MKNNNTTVNFANRLLSIVAVLLVISGAIYLSVYLFTASDFEETNDAQVESYINPVSARAAVYFQSTFEDTRFYQEIPLSF